MLRKLLTGVAVMALATAVTAQNQMAVHKATTPKFAGVYRVPTGELLPPSAAGRSGPAVIFNNATWTGYFGVGFPSDYVIIDEGGLLDRSACKIDQINGFDFAYCSTLTTENIEILFWDDTVECVGPANPAAFKCAYLITGLPGGTGGYWGCWLVMVDLEGDLSAGFAGADCPSTASATFATEGSTISPEGRFGYAYNFAGYHPPYPIAFWGPIIMSGGYNTADDFVIMSRTTWGCWMGYCCWWYGGFVFASHWMTMYGYNANSIVYYSPNAAYPRALDNRNLRNTTAVTKGGAPETWTVAPVTAGRSYWLAASAAPWDQAFNGSGGQGTGLAQWLNTLPPTPMAMPGGSLTVNIPTGAPANVYVQAAETNGSLKASNVTGVSNGIHHCF